MRGGESSKIPQQYVERRKLKRMPFIQLHSLTNLSPPLISLATLSSFPPGEAKGSKLYAFTIHDTALFHKRLGGKPPPRQIR